MSEEFKESDHARRIAVEVVSEVFGGKAPRIAEFDRDDWKRVPWQFGCDRVLIRAARADNGALERFQATLRQHAVFTAQQLHQDVFSKLEDFELASSPAECAEDGGPLEPKADRYVYQVDFHY